MNIFIKHLLFSLGTCLLLYFFFFVTRQHAQTQPPPVPPPLNQTSSSGGIQAESNLVTTRVGNAPVSSSSASTNLAAVLDWDTKIVDSLQSGIWGYINRLVTAITNGSYSTGTWSGSSDSTVYWCTYSIIDAYNLAGVEGLSKSKHAAVVNMRRFWMNAPKDTYDYAPYDSDNSTLASVKPGYAIFMERYPGVFSQNEHVSMVKEISLNQRGDGYIISQDSNSSSKTHKFSISGWSVISGATYPVRGFGGLSGQSIPQPSSGTNGFFATLPGTSAGAAILGDGQKVDLNGTRAQPSFSVIKLWIAAFAFKNLPMSSTYTITEADKIGGTGRLQFGPFPNTITNRDLIRHMLVYSDNMATNILIKTLGGFAEVNNFISQAGYNQTRVQRYLGETNYTTANDNYTSASDGVRLMQNLYNGSVVNPQVSNEIIAILHERRAKEDPRYVYICRKIPNTDCVEKSGIGPRTRNDTGSFIAKSGKRIFLSVLTTDVSNEPAAEEEIAKIAEMLYDTQ